MSDPTADLFAALHRWVAALYPGQLPAEVRVRLTAGGWARLPVPPTPPRSDAPATRRPGTPKPEAREEG